MCSRNIVWRKKDAVMDFRHLSHSAFAPDAGTKWLSREPARAEKFPCHGAWIIAFDRDFFVQIAPHDRVARKRGREYRQYSDSSPWLLPVPRVLAHRPAHFESMKIEGFQRAVGGIGHRGIDARNSVGVAEVSPQREPGAGSRQAGGRRLPRRREGQRHSPRIPPKRQV
jgi:hypothetical protein